MKNKALYYVVVVGSNGKADAIDKNETPKGIRKTGPLCVPINSKNRGLWTKRNAEAIARAVEDIAPNLKVYVRRFS